MQHSIQLTPPRNPSMDLLRALAIFMIICQHLIGITLGLGGLQNNSIELMSFQTFFLEFIHCFSVLGVNLFFLLSGYFGIKQKLGKVSSMIIRTYLLYFFVNILYVAFGKLTFGGVWEAIKFFLAAASQYWFVLAYVLLYLFSPILNLIADHLSRKKLTYFIFIALLIFCIIGFIENYGRVLGMNKGYSPIWGGLVYLYGRIIRLHEHSLKTSKRFWGLIFLLFVLLNFICVVICTIAQKGAWAYALMCHYNNPLLLGASVSLLLTFANFTLKNKVVSKICTCISKHTLGIYILHIVIPFGFLIDLSTNFYLRLLSLLPNAFIVLLGCLLVDVLYDLTINKLLKKPCVFIESILVNIYAFLMHIVRKFFLQNKDAKE